ncbi:uncharacterized protein DFL_007043 [Arthrobotrys flagrans]|uniref:Uncharacterized protein n=1 Tax=Arthrobotrys flagrans TaxID=97331 RepID=A0A436ZV52_ARTFL|nr:hypothetical protein DFL_007043 [Arthrobotrys flagrans]
MSTPLSIIEVTESALESLLKDGNKIIAWIAKNIGVKTDKPTLLTRLEELLEFSDSVFFWIELIDTLKNRYITKFGNLTGSPEHPRALRMWKSVAKLGQMWIVKMLDACYSYYTSGNPCEPVLIRAWNEAELLVRCPRCGSDDSWEYTKPPYVGYPLVYEHTCKDSSEARRYQAIFPYVIHQLTTSGEQPIGYQLHPSGKYWVTVGENFPASYWKLDPESSLFKMHESTERLAKSLSSLNLSTEGPNPSSRNSLLEFDRIDIIRSLSDTVEKRIGHLHSFQQILEIYDEDETFGAITWNIASSVQSKSFYSRGRMHDLMEDEWVCKEKQKGKRWEKTLLRAKTKPSEQVRTAGLARRGRPYNDLVTFSGASFEDDLKYKTSEIPLTGDSHSYFNTHRLERSPYPDENLRDWAKELSEILEMKYDGHNVLSWPNKTLNDVHNYECSHIEKKVIVWYLMIHGIWRPKEKEGTMPKAKHKQNHILRFYGSQKPCKWCVEFLEKVTKQFSTFGLCIGWHNVPEEEKARRPAPAAQGEIGRPLTAKERDKGRCSVSLTYINVCGLGVDITRPALPVVLAPELA